MHAWNFIMHLGPYTWKLMHQVLAFEVNYCTLEKAWIVDVMKYQTRKLFLISFISKAYWVLIGATAI